MSTWSIPGPSLIMKPPFTEGWNTRCHYSAPGETRMDYAHGHRLKVGCCLGGRSRKQESQFPLRLYHGVLRHRRLSCNRREGRKARKGRKGIMELNDGEIPNFQTLVQASIDNSEKQDGTELDNSTRMEEELRRSKSKFAPFCSNLGGPSRGRKLMNYAFGGVYERDIIHKEIVRRMNSVEAAQLDKSEGFYVRSTTENGSFRSEDFDHGPDDIVALEEDRYIQLGREHKIVEEGATANSHAMKKRRLPVKEHDEQGRWARRSLLNHCIPAILEKLGFNFSFMNLAASQGLSSPYNVNVTVSYDMRFQPVAEQGFHFVNESQTGNNFQQDRKLFTTDSIRQVARPVNFLSSKGDTVSKVNVTRKAGNQLDNGRSPSLRPNLNLDSQMMAPNPRLSGVRRRPERLWLQADGDSNAPQSNIWRDLFTIIGLSAFIICGTYAFAVSNRYLKFGSKTKPTSVSTRGHCGSDPHSATSMKQPLVLELTNCNFESAVSKKPTFVLFYAPWCSHCQQMEHTWRELACRLPKKGYDVQLAQMDAEKYSQMAEKFKVVKYPTLIFYKDGKLTDSHTGPRDVDSLMTFIDENYM